MQLAVADFDRLLPAVVCFRQGRVAQECVFVGLFLVAIDAVVVVTAFFGRSQPKRKQASAAARWALWGIFVVACKQRSADT